MNFSTNYDMQIQICPTFEFASELSPRSRKPGKVVYVVDENKFYYWFANELIAWPSTSISKTEVPITELAGITIPYTDGLKIKHGNNPLIQFIDADTGAYTTISVIATGYPDITDLTIDFGEVVSGTVIIG